MNSQRRTACLACSAKGSSPSKTFASETVPSLATTISSKTTASPVPPFGYATSVLPRAIGGLTGGTAWAPAELVYPTRIHANNRGAVERATHSCLLVLAGAISPLFARTTPFLHFTIFRAQASGRLAQPGDSPSIAASCGRCLSNEVEADSETERPRRADPAAVDADLAVAQVVAARADTGRQRVRRLRRALSSCTTSNRRVCSAAVNLAAHEAGRVSAAAAGRDAGAAHHRAAALGEARTNPPAVEAVLVDRRARAILRARFVRSTQRWTAAGGRYGDWSQATGPSPPPTPVVPPAALRPPVPVGTVGANRSPPQPKAATLMTAISECSYAAILPDTERALACFAVIGRETGATGMRGRRERRHRAMTAGRQRRLALGPQCDGPLADQEGC